MRMNKLIIMLVGALLCAPAFTACQDDPEPVTPETPVDPESPPDEKPEFPDGIEKSWFDQPEEDRWLMRWMLGDDEAMRGPGEYEFQVPASGDEFTFWFPDCDQFLRWADLDGVVQLNMDGSSPLDPYACHGVEYIIVDDNCVQLTVQPNGYSFPRRFALCFHSKRGGGIVRYVFNQDAGDGSSDGYGDGKVLYWRSGSEPIIHYSPDFSGYEYLEILPENDTEQIALHCMNADNLEIESLTDIKWNSIGNLSINKAVCPEMTVTTKNDSLLIDLTPNFTKSYRSYILTVKSGDKKVLFRIYQRYKDSPDKGKIYPYDPKWLLVDDGTVWTGGISNDGVFRISGRGDSVTVKSLNYGALLGLSVKVNEKTYRTTTYILTGKWSDWDTPVLGNAASLHHYVWEVNKMDFKFIMNMTGRERVIEVHVMYMVAPQSISNWYSIMDPAFGFIERFIFVQPPWNPDTKGVSESDCQKANLKNHIECDSIRYEKQPEGYYTRTFVSERDL